MRREESPFGEFRKVVLPIFVKFRDGDLECVGSCFLVCCDGKGHALAITARHVVETVLNLDEQQSTSDSFFKKHFGQVSEEHIEWKNIEAFTIAYDGAECHPCPVHNFSALSDESDDLAIAKLRLPPNARVRFQKKLWIASRGPKPDTPLLVLGYPRQEVTDRVRDERGLITEAVLGTGLKSVETRARPLAADSSQPHPVKGPCFGLDTQEVASGMSGGPVVYQAEDGYHWVACGMVSWSTEIRNFAVASVLCPLLRMKVASRLAGIDIKNPTLADLARHGVLVDVDQG